MINKQELLTPNKIIKSNRKSISLIIKNNGEFIVRAPKTATNKRIFEFINQKANWIITKRQNQLSEQSKTLTFENLEHLTILGLEYIIQPASTARVKVCENKIYIPKTNAKEKLIRFLKRWAKDYFQIRTQELAKQYNFTFEKVSVSSAKTCWGSCSGKNNIHLTYKLMLCLPEVVDYTIIHELCHTKVKNHSEKFWTLVEKCCPNYKQCEIWLKKNRMIVEVI